MGTTKKNLKLPHIPKNAFIKRYKMRKIYIKKQFLFTKKCTYLKNQKSKKKLIFVSSLAYDVK